MSNESTEQGTPKTRLAVVLGTYNRAQYLQIAVESVRRAAGALDVTLVVIDGGSTDGSREWLAKQPDVVLLGQRGPLTGAVRAFNLGFGYAVDAAFPYVMHFNDDAVIQGHDPPALEAAVALLEQNPNIGEVAFAFDLRNPGTYGFPEHVHGLAYANFGVVRLPAGMAVAREQGDATGHAWWNPIYHTYAADTEFGVWLHKLGWKIHKAHDLRVHDANAQDALRSGNDAIRASRGDSGRFQTRWPSIASLGPLARDVRVVAVSLAGQPPANIPWKGARLHLGCGSHRLPGWINVDGLLLPTTDVVMDFSSGVPAIPDESLQTVYWSHGPEHIHPDLLPAVLQDLHRALAPGGELIVAAPSFDGIAKHRFYGHLNGSAWLSALFGECASTDHPFLAHKQVFTHDSLRTLLEQAGFGSVTGWEPNDYGEIDRANDHAKTSRLVSVLLKGTASGARAPRVGVVSTPAGGDPPSIPPAATGSTKAARWFHDDPSAFQSGRAPSYGDSPLLVPPEGLLSPNLSAWASERGGGGERVLHLALRTPDEKQMGLARALARLGGDSRDVDWIAEEARGGTALENAVLEAAKALRPTLVFMQLQRRTAITPAVVQSLRALCDPNVVIMNWDGDQHHEPGSPEREWFVELGKVCDTSLVVNTAHPALYADMGVKNAGFLEIGIDGDLYAPLNADELVGPADRPLVLLASNYPHVASYGRRVEVVRALQTTFRKSFGVYGGGWERWESGKPMLRGREETTAYVRARGAVSMSIRNDLPRYTSDRLFRALAAGALVFVERFPDLEGLGVRHNENALVWSDPTDLLMTLARYMSTSAGIRAEVDQDVARIRAAAVKTGRWHTWAARMPELMAIVETVRERRSAS